LPTPSRHEPRGLHADLYAAVRDGELKAPRAEAMQLVLAAALGVLEGIDVSVDKVRGKGGEIKLLRAIAGVGQTELPRNSTIVFSDATGQAEEYRAALGRPVRDITPRGRLERLHPVLQIIPHQDVTRKTGVARAGEVIHGVLTDIP